MQIALVAIALVIALSMPAAADTAFAAYPAAEPPFEVDREKCGRGPGGGLIGYHGSDAVCADLLISRPRESASLLEGSTTEIVLLTSRPNEPTLYRADRDAGAILPLENLTRGHRTRLTIRGQRDAEDRHLVWFKGFDLIDTICDPDRVLDAIACRDGRPADQEITAEPWDRRYELTSLALVEEAGIERLLREAPERMGRVTRRGPRAYCVRLRHVVGLRIEDLAFEDCWIVAVLAVNSSDIALAGARIHGSTFGLLAIATGGMEALTHTFRVTDTHWLQSPSRYRYDSGDCERPHLDLSCALDAWYDIPWGVTHHHIWRPLNGALFGAYNIAGNVLFAENVVESAYNGIRMISDLPGTGRNVEVRGNHFKFLRDNAVEPEAHAYGWIVKHNVFENVHAWITSDGVSGSGMYIFGNRGWYDPQRMPGQRCRTDVDWSRSPRLDGLAGDEARYLLIDVSYDPTSVTCDGHIRGAVLKTGDKRKTGFPYLDHIAIFNNSWRTRSPLFASKHAAPLTHFNNAIEFTGCGLSGPLSCRQVPAPLQYCQAGNKRTRGRVPLRQFWTEDGGALVADCFTFTPGPAEPDDRVSGVRDVDHLFCRDAYNRAPTRPEYLKADCAEIVRDPIFAGSGDHRLALAAPIAGCRPMLEGGRIRPDCSENAIPVGAYTRTGVLFDMEIQGAGFLGDRFRP